MEKWHRTYYKLRKIGAVYMESNLKQEIKVQILMILRTCNYSRKLLSIVFNSMIRFFQRIPMIF